MPRAGRLYGEAARAARQELHDQFDRIEGGVRIPAGKPAPEDPNAMEGRWTMAKTRECCIVVANCSIATEAARMFPGSYVTWPGVAKVGRRFDEIIMLWRPFEDHATFGMSKASVSQLQEREWWMELQLGLKPGGHVRWLV